jgi:hypothetical protein
MDWIYLAEPANSTSADFTSLPGIKTASFSFTCLLMLMGFSFPATSPLKPPAIAGEFNSTAAATERIPQTHNLNHFMIILLYSFLPVYGNGISNQEI